MSVIHFFISTTYLCWQPYLYHHPPYALHTHGEYCFWTFLCRSSASVADGVLSFQAGQQNNKCNTVFNMYSSWNTDRLNIEK